MLEYCVADHDIEPSLNAVFADFLSGLFLERGIRSLLVHGIFLACRDDDKFDHKNFHQL